MPDSIFVNPGTSWGKAKHRMAEGPEIICCTMPTAAIENVDYLNNNKLIVDGQFGMPLIGMRDQSSWKWVSMAEIIDREGKIVWTHIEFLPRIDRCCNRPRMAVIGHDYIMSDSAGFIMKASREEWVYINKTMK